jgi:hypothetical protein
MGRLVLALLDQDRVSDACNAPAEVDFQRLAAHTGSVKPLKYPGLGRCFDAEIRFLLESHKPA